MTEADEFQDALQALVRACRIALHEGHDLSNKHTARPLEAAFWQYEKLARKLFGSEIDNE